MSWPSYLLGGSGVVIAGVVSFVGARRGVRDELVAQRYLSFEERVWDRRYSLYIDMAKTITNGLRAWEVRDDVMYAASFARLQAWSVELPLIASPATVMYWGDLIQVMVECSFAPTEAPNPDDHERLAQAVSQMGNRFIHDLGTADFHHLDRETPSDVERMRQMGILPIRLETIGAIRRNHVWWRRLLHKVNLQ